jgi:hypothetical protein
MVTAWRGVDLALFRQGLSPFGRQMAVMPCPCLRRSDGWNPNLDGWTALDHPAGVGCPTRSVAALCCGCGSMAWSGYGAEQRQVKAVRPVRQDGPARPVSAGHRIGPAFAGCGGQRPCPGRKRQDARLCLAGGSCGGTMVCDDARRCDNPVAAPLARHRRGGAYAGGKPVSSARPARGKRGFGLRPGQGAMTQGRRRGAAVQDKGKGTE